MLRSLAYGIGGLAICFVIAAGIEYSSDPIFWDRYLNPPANPMEPGPDFYQPQFSMDEPASPFFATVERGEVTIDPAVLETAAEWTANTGGTAFIVVHKNKIQIERYWDVGGADELMTGRAMTKTLNALLAGAAIGEGKLALDDRIGNYIEGWADEPQGDITLRDLLYQASGLENPPLGPGAWNRFTRSAYTGDVVKVALEHELAHEPGSVFDIGNVTSQLIAIVVQNAVGRPVQDYFVEKIWQPIGADRGSFFMDRADGMIHIDCCFRTTPHNWMRVGALLLNDGIANGTRVLPEGWVDVMTTSSPRNPNYGMHIWLGREYAPVRPYSEIHPVGVPHAEPFVSEDIYFIEGGGYRTLYVIPSEDLLILRLGKRHDDWDSAYLPNRLVEGILRETVAP
ncbi:MAG: serine hydrolase domain-containing protein [Rhodospirillaceae bacterium]|jgi:CubicO group peptidase (beta-lactamase class C family)